MTYPACFESQMQYDGWIQLYRLSGETLKNGYCSDCTPEYCNEMKLQNRCAPISHVTKKSLIDGEKELEKKRCRKCGETDYYKFTVKVNNLCKVCTSIKNKEFREAQKLKQIQPKCRCGETRPEKFSPSSPRCCVACHAKFNREYKERRKKISLSVMRAHSDEKLGTEQAILVASSVVVGEDASKWIETFKGSLAYIPEGVIPGNEGIRATVRTSNHSASIQC